MMVMDNASPFDLSAFKSSFSRLKKEYSALNERIQKQALENAPIFNVFDILQLSRSEVRTHSAMIAELLNPSGNHGQGVLFLKKFIEICVNKDSTFPIPKEIENTSGWEVEVEKVVGRSSRLDIVVSNPSIGHVIAIENKIDAPEQPGQMQRYSEWLTKRLHIYPQQALIFLTLYGKKSLTAEGVVYLTLSYHEDITNWLDSCIPGIKATNVSATVHQYRELVRRL